jgi:hypothetical protein
MNPDKRKPSSKPKELTTASQMTGVKGNQNSKEDIGL